MRRFISFVLFAAVALTSACGSFQNTAESTDDLAAPERRDAPRNSGEFENGIDGEKRSTIWDAFGAQYNEQKVQVNRYIWAASLDVLNFLPVQSVDPFTGVILTGYGTPPGGNQAYRATVHVRDPALEARSLSLALQTRNGRSVSPETLRAVEDAILSRARQMRIADRKL